MLGVTDTLNTLPRVTNTLRSPVAPPTCIMVLSYQRRHHSNCSSSSSSVWSSPSSFGKEERHPWWSHLRVMPDSPKVWPTADVYQMHAARNLVPMAARGSWSGGAREEGRGQGRMEKEKEWLWSSGSARPRRPLACFFMSVRHDYLDMVRTSFSFCCVRHQFSVCVL